MTNESTRLQQALFFQPINPDKQKHLLRTRNPLLTELFWPFSVHPKPYMSNGQVDGRELVEVHLANSSKVMYSPKNASWRRMLMQQPPTSTIGFIAGNRSFVPVSEDHKHWVVDFYNSSKNMGDGSKHLRMGDLCDPISRELFTYTDDDAWVFYTRCKYIHRTLEQSDWGESMKRDLGECDLVITTWAALQVIGSHVRPVHSEIKYDDWVYKFLDKHPNHKITLS